MIARANARARGKLHGFPFVRRWNIPYRLWFPLAIFDERLTGHFKTDVPAAGAWDALEVQCQLIYLSHARG